MRANGAITGGAGGFSPDDEVIVLRKLDGSKTYVIGHVAGVKPCGGFAVFFVYLEGKAKKSIVVWDIAKQAFKFLSTDYDDPAFTAWLNTKKSFGSQMFGTLTDCGFMEPTTDNGSQAATCPGITPGLTDIWTFVESNVGSNRIDVWHWDFNSKKWTRGYIGGVQPLSPASMTCPVNIPDSPISVAGYRLHWTWDKTLSTNMDTSVWSQSTDTEFVFYGPLGLLSGFSGHGTANGGYGGINAGDETYIPDWSAWGYYPFDKEYYGSSLWGLFDEKIIVDCYMIQFCSVEVVTTYDPYLGAQYTYTFSARQVHVQAQALFCQEGSKGYNWVAAGRNSTLESELVSAVQLAYGLNSIANNVINKGYISIGLYR